MIGNLTLVILTRKKSVFSAAKLTKNADKNLLIYICLVSKDCLKWCRNF